MSVLVQQELPILNTLNTFNNQDVLRSDPSSAEFKNLKISTMTMVIATNWKLDIGEAFNLFPIVDFVVVPKKRGRKKKGIIVDPNKDIESGSIICLEYSGKRRGPELKPDKTKKNGKEGKTKPFRNSVSIVMKVGDKYVNGKLSNNGKIQITGSKKLQHTIEFVNNIWKLIQLLSEEGKMKCTLKGKDTVPKAVIKIVMTNIDYDIGYNIDRLKFDSHIKMNDTGFLSIFHPSSAYSGVNVKRKSVDPIDNRMTAITWSRDGNMTQRRCPYEEYLSLLSDKDRVKELKPRDKYHTFLVFYSGRVIQSGPSYQEMEKVRKIFIDMTRKNMNRFIERVSE